MEQSFHGLGATDRAQRVCIEGHLPEPKHVPQTFGYLFDANPINLGSLDPANVLAAWEKMIDALNPVGNPDVMDGPAEAGQTFFGQFIDHDITLDTTSEIGTRINPRAIRNVRTPQLDLDCIYGDGPEASPHLYSAKHKDYMLLGHGDNLLDLPRTHEGRAMIGDFRNDENILLANIQSAFIALHNILMHQAMNKPDVAGALRHCAGMGLPDGLIEGGGGVFASAAQAFQAVRRFIRLHYQYLVLNEFLPSFVDPTVVHAVKAHDPFHDQGPPMPVEFSVACFRFGHITVQESYKLREDAGLSPLFDNNNPGLRGFAPRPESMNIDMDLFFGPQAQRARPVGLSMAPTLFALPDGVVPADATLEWNGFTLNATQAKKLALRNVLRDRTSLSLISGQKAADALGLERVTAPDALAQAGITRTPLWFYVLQEAALSGNQRLTGVGGRIVASVLIRLLKLDRESVWHILPTFTPWVGFTDGGDMSMSKLMAFVEDNREDVPIWDELRTPASR